MTNQEIHELYLRLTDIQTQLESNIGDEDELETEKRRINLMLIIHGYDPDNEPENIYPENQ